MNVQEAWKTGVASEVAFWRAVFVGTQFPDYHRDLLERMDPDRPLMPWIAQRLRSDVPVNEVRILDVAAGPVSCIGWQVNRMRPQIVAIDALAVQYRALLDEFRMVPPVYTQACDGEEMDQRFPHGSFDVVHIRNALDHCYEPIAVIGSALRLLRPGGSLFIHGYTDEAEAERYVGLHQWNVRVDGGRLIVWRPGVRHDVEEHFAGLLQRVEVMQDDPHRWTAATLMKKRDATVAGVRG